MKSGNGKIDRQYFHYFVEWKKNFFSTDIYDTSSGNYNTYEILRTILIYLIIILKKETRQTRAE